MISREPLPREQALVQPLVESFNDEGHPEFDDMEEYERLKILPRPQIKCVARNTSCKFKIWHRFHQFLHIKIRWKRLEGGALTRKHICGCEAGNAASQIDHSKRSDFVTGRAMSWLRNGRSEGGMLDTTKGRSAFTRSARGSHEGYDEQEQATAIRRW